MLKNFMGYVEKIEEFIEKHPKTATAAPFVATGTAKGFKAVFKAFKKKYQILYMDLKEIDYEKFNNSIKELDIQCSAENKDGIISGQINKRFRREQNAIDLVCKLPKLIANYKIENLREK